MKKKKMSLMIDWGLLMVMVMVTVILKSIEILILICVVFAFEQCGQPWLMLCNAKVNGAREIVFQSNEFASKIVSKE
jgi:hypothetical protein